MKNLKVIVLGLATIGSLLLGSNNIEAAQKLEKKSKVEYTSQAATPAQQIEVVEVTKEVETTKEEIKDTNRNNSFKIENTYRNNNSTIIEFSDGSSALIDESKGLYEFYHVDLGDWATIADSKENLINIIKTYMELRYNMSEEEINNHEIFKKANLSGQIEKVESPKHIAKVEDTKVIEVTKEVEEVSTTPEVEEIENNEIVESTEEKQEIESTEDETTEDTEEVIQDLEEVENNNTEEENIKAYIAYKNSLIEQYGEEMYNRMNEEAGITTEEESYLHFLKYGI